VTSGAVSERYITGVRERLLGRLRAVKQGTDFQWGYVGKVLFVIAAYYVAAHIGYAFDFAGPVASIIWLPVGVGTAAAFLLGPSIWPGVVIGDLLVNNYAVLPTGSAVGQSLGNLLEILIAAGLLRRFAARGQPLESVGGVARMIAALIAGTAVSATIGLLSLYLGDVVALRAVPHLWRTWWLGDLCGALIVVPLVIAWVHIPRRPWVHGHMVELLSIMGTLVVLIAAALQAGRPVSYLVLPALTWAALQYGARGATLAIAVGATATVIATTDHIGRFVYQSVDANTLDIQLFLIVSTLSTLWVVALVRERELLEENVRASRRRIVTAADEERRRIEHDVHDGAQQRLVALAARLGLAASRARSKPKTAGPAFRRAQSELLIAIEELRGLVHGIRPQALRRFGLARAIEAVVARSNTRIELSELPEQRFDDTAEATAYYVVLEALTNAERHAHASTIRASVRAQTGRLRVEIEDNGVGGAVEQDDLGLQGLRDRVEAIGGRFSVNSGPGGTTVAALIPATEVASQAA
jgi:signal transduction histidine kinase